MVGDWRVLAVNRSLLSANLLVGQPFVAVCQINDAAISEPVLLEDVLQDEVVAVGVCPKVL